MTDNKIISGIYQIEHEIGSGGGGVVYLGRHLRLDKPVVLKADKRPASANLTSLRGEVDALKNLTHTYIPQVYDFVIDGETVYTVMDFIEGESLDKSLKRGQRFEQAQVIEWARQLLDALCYLHSRPPHGILHSDIKPANIMITPQGDIRLIDYNIALALGSEGAVSVGRSFGYASPEHYGVDYGSGGTETTKHSDTDKASDSGTTVLDDKNSTEVSDAATVLEQSVPSVPSGSSGSSKRVTLDVRSDIYGLGATLYHLLSGIKPVREAKLVSQLSDKQFSPSVVAMISKAMAPERGKRYQTAQDMLNAVNRLHDDDPRTKQYRRTRNITVIALVVMLILSGVSTFAGLNRRAEIARAIAEAETARAEAETARAEEEAARAEEEAARAEEEAARAKEEEAQKNIEAALKNAEYSANELTRGNVPQSIDYALISLSPSGSFTPPYLPQAQKALADALGVYDLSDGFKPHKTLELPSEALKIVISPNGNTVAAMVLGMLTIFDTESSDVIATLPTVNSALSDVKFIDDSRLIFAGADGVSVFDLSSKNVVWIGKPATEIAVSADGSTFAAVYKDEDFATIYDTAGNIINLINFDGKQQRVTVNDSFANPDDNLLALNSDGTWLAVSFTDGALIIYSLIDSENIVEIFDESEFFHFEGGFSSDFFAFSSTGSESSVFAVIDMQYLAQTGGFESVNPFGVIADERGIYISNEDVVVKIDPISGEQEEVAYTTDYVICFSIGGGNALAGVKDGSFAFFDNYARPTVQYKSVFMPDLLCINGDYAVVGNRNTPTIRILKQKDHKSFFEYDSEYSHDETRLNAESTTIMFFSYSGFRLYTIDGVLLNEVVLPDTNQIYDQQYKRDESGSRLEVIYYDGKTNIYSGDTGELISTEQRDKPDSSLYEEFFTDRLKITSPLHGVPIAYDIKSGEQVKELEKDAYLTYVTQVGDNIITEYISTDGVRYGLLLDGKSCETLAYLPDLCDIIGERLIFDIRSGYLRETRLYEISELINQVNH